MICRRMRILFPAWFTRLGGICFKHKRFLLLLTTIILACCLINNIFTKRILHFSYSNYAGSKITKGITVHEGKFYLNDRSIEITSGSLHYFRVHPTYWRQRIRQMKAAGLNTIDTYVPWNLHEPMQGVFDFGKGNNDMSEFLDVVQFVKLVEEEEMLLILRPGPYICAEWEYGGMPSWLLRNKNIRVRSSQKEYLDPATRYLEKVLKILKPFQWSNKYGAKPIIMAQIENEYGSFDERDELYMKSLHHTFSTNGFGNTFLFVSDNHIDTSQVVPYNTFQAINFKDETIKNIRKVKRAFPNLPILVMEFWPGWFDWWGFQHHRTPSSDLEENTEPIFKNGISINFYMFHGGTNFGFLNGAYFAHWRKQYVSDVTSYDYDAPISESGEYTEKYYTISALIRKYRDIGSISNLEMPKAAETHMFPTVKLNRGLDFNSILKNTIKLEHISTEKCNQEALNINMDSGQMYGFTAYKPMGLNLTRSNEITIECSGLFKDLVYVILDGQIVTKVFIHPVEYNYQLKRVIVDHPITPENELIILVENMGRINYGFKDNFRDFKGIVADSVKINSMKVKFWTVYPLEFKSEWLKSLKQWRELDTKHPVRGPILLKGQLEVVEPVDTFINMARFADGQLEFTKGNVFINGFNLGRYWNLGPQRTLYLPGPLLVKGTNEIVVFEIFESSSSLFFSSKPRLDSI